MTTSMERSLSLVAQGAMALRRARRHPEGANEGYLAVHGAVARAFDERKSLIGDVLQDEAAQQ